MIFIAKIANCNYNWQEMKNNGFFFFRTMCVLVENSSGRLRRWKQENCRKASLISSATSVLKSSIINAWVSAMFLVAIMVM